jgi:hypothetical protein
MFDGKQRVVRFLYIRAIRAIAIIFFMSLTFLMAAAAPQQALNAAPAPQNEQARNQPSQSPQSQAKGNE